MGSPQLVAAVCSVKEPTQLTVDDQSSKNCGTLSFVKLYFIYSNYYCSLHLYILLCAKVQDMERESTGIAGEEIRKVEKNKKEEVIFFEVHLNRTVKRVMGGGNHHK